MESTTTWMLVGKVKKKKKNLLSPFYLHTLRSPSCVMPEGSFPGLASARCFYFLLPVRVTAAITPLMSFVGSTAGTELLPLASAGDEQATRVPCCCVPAPWTCLAMEAALDRNTVTPQDRMVNTSQLKWTEVTN